MIGMYIVLTDVSHLFSDDWTIYLASISFVLDLAPKRLTLLPLTLPIISSLPFCFPSSTHTYSRCLSLTFSPTSLPSRAPSSVEKVVSSSALSRRFGFASECRETSWFVWQTQMPLNSPQPRLLTSLIPCNALFTSSLAPHPTSPHAPHPTLLRQEKDSHTRLPWQKIHTALTSLLQVGN